MTPGGMTPGGITGIDHILWPVRDLDEARMGWTRLGFVTSPRGTHLGRGTGNYCIMFEHDYLELFGILAPEQAGEEYRRFLAAREGPMMLAWATADAAAAARALAARGLHPGAPRDLGRQLELPEGSVVPRFELVALAAAETPGLDSFLCAHRTPELMRRPEWLAHANGASGLRGVTVVVAEPAALADSYERLFGPAKLHATDDMLNLQVGRHRILFATADDVAAMHPEIDLPAALAPPFIAVLTLDVADAETTADHLAEWQIAHETTADGRILVPAEMANGAVLEFVAARRAARL